MSTLFGWLGAAVADGSQDAIIDRMAAAQAFGEARDQRLRHLPGMGLAVRGAGDLAEDGAICAAITGRPRWESADLAALAAGRGHAAALIEAYRRDGEQLFRHLRGAFSVALFDRDKDRALLAIDRLGIVSLVHSTPRAGGLVFGSTADVVRAHPAVTSTISPQGIFNYLFFAVLPSPGTIYREHAKLLPAQYLVYERGTARTGFYWRMPYREANAAPVAELTEELMRHLRAAVARDIAGADAAELGAFLSGGLDSSTVAGLLSEASGGHAKTFTIGFEQKKYDEVSYAEIAARHFKTEQHNYYLTAKDVVGILADVSRAFDEPFGNSSVIPAYVCARMAKEHGVSLMLAGDGGDEIFAGNSRYVDQSVFGLYGRVPAALRRGLIEPLVNATGLDRVPLLRRARGYIRQANLPMPDRLENYNFYHNAELRLVFEPDFLATIDPAAPLATMREAYDRSASDALVQRMMHLDLKITLADNDLRKVNVACAMAGVGVAYPFLDDDVVEFSAQLPSSLLLRRFERRWFFRQAVKDFLAPDTLAKRKHGFGMPFAEWPRQDAELRAIAVDCIEGFTRRHYLRADFLAQIRDDSQHDGLVWDIMMLELWMREREAKIQDSAGTRIVA